MRKIKKDSQMHLRCTSQQKEDVKKILKIIGKKSDFIIEFFLDNFSNNAAILELQKHSIDREIADTLDEIKYLNEKAEMLKSRSKIIDDEINNRKLYDLTYYKNNEAVTKAVNSIKTYVIQREITNFNDIPENTFYEINTTFKVNDVKLLMEICRNEYEGWYAELKENNKLTINDKMQSIANRLNTDFKRQNKITDWNDYIESRNEYIESKAKADDELHHVDLKLFLSRKKYQHD